MQSIKSRQHELDLKKIIIIAGPNGAGKKPLAVTFCLPKLKRSGLSTQI